MNKELIVLQKTFELADPTFAEPGTIDMLLGAGVFWEILCMESFIQKVGIPRLQKTSLGWIIGGELLDTRKQRLQQFCGMIATKTLQARVERFWNQKEMQETRHWIKEEAECERQFNETCKRDKDGRFIVALPQKTEVILGESTS